MTWLSRLLNESSSLHHNARDGRVRQSKRRRHISTLECLEDRRLLSGQAGNVTLQYNPVTLALQITGDAFNDGIRVVEKAQDDPANPGGVTVSGIVGLLGATTINGSPASITVGPVTSISVNFNTGGTVNNFDKLIVTGPGKNVQTTVGAFTVNVGLANLGLSVNNVDNTGAFTLNTSGNLNGPGLNATQISTPSFVTGFATIDNSTFASLSITQTSATCQALVELGADTISGPVNVSLGGAAGDQIIAAVLGGVPNVFGVTTLSEGGGAGDIINVGNVGTTLTRVQRLTITQGNGAGDSINVQSVQITNPIGNVLGAGVSTTQGEGAGDTTIINNVSVASAAPPFNFPPGPNVLAGIRVVQGNGNSDAATVTNSTVLGNISVSQGNGNTDTALVNNDLIVANPVVAGNITVSQGNGNQDSATISNSTAPGNISISQGNGGPTNVTTGTTGDSALILNDTTVSNPQGVLGNLSITQGNGNFNKATVIGSTALGNVSITQGSGSNDSALIGPTVAGVNVSISQGNGNSDTATVTAVTAGGSITISQLNGNSDAATISNSTTADGVTISQGNGNSDTALMTRDTVAGDITITQANGTTDTVSVTGTRAGSFTVSGGFVTSETGGQLTITQGNGAGDVVNLDSAGGVNDVFNNVSITQGNASIAAPGGGQGSPGSTLGDTVNVNDTNITSNLLISQGGGFGGAGAGNYTVNIGVTSAVTAGGFSVIQQAGTQNSVFLGTNGVTAASFTTSFLDIWTGSGGSFVVAQNTNVVIGAAGFFFGFVIDSNGGSNLFIDAGGNTNVSASPFFDTIQFP